MNKIEKEIISRLTKYEQGTRVAWSKKYPALKKPIIACRHQFRNILNLLDFRITKIIKKDYFDFIISRHQSLLRRKLGDSNPKLQEQKITNLRQAIARLDGLVIKPNQVFSFWHNVGKPDSRKGYVDGMLLSGGQVIEGIGGGLCQLSNLLYWLFLHAPVEIIERYHHSMDVFPDSGRVLPFGSGATILYNFIDLKCRNISDSSLQLKLWLTDNHLKGQLLSDKKIKYKFHVLENNHYFIKRGDKYFRFNEIYREIFVDGNKVKKEKITSNFAPVLYPVSKKYLSDNNFKVLDLSKKQINK